MREADDSDVGAKYEEWAEAGYLTICPGNEVDLDMVADAIAMIIADPEGNKAKATEIVKGLTDRYPLYE